jgi:uncharacterized protein (DUF302 family)
MINNFCQKNEIFQDELTFTINNIVMAYYSRRLKISFQDAIDKVTANLKLQGFGIITTIDLKDTFKQKLNVGFRNYRILGACNPQFAYKAVSLESHMGIMLPCNVVIQEHENGEIEITAVNPLETLEASLSSTGLGDLASEVGSRLRTAIDDIDRDCQEEHCDALPTERNESNYICPIMG